MLIYNLLMEKLITKGFLILFLLLTCSMQAQQKTVNGTILDVAGTPLPGATITIKGTSNGVSSDFDGKFSINVNENDILTISFVGFVSQDIPIAGKTSIEIVLAEDTNLLDEVVVVGFGTQKKENVTGAASFVKMDELIGDRPIVNSAQALQGVAAGLQVISNSGQPGSTGTSLNIRGVNSINGGSPLVLVNNVPMSLSDVNPRDIESVSILKDAAASSIYGARAAFGVILITTKQAKKNEAMQFSYSTTTSFSSPVDLPEKATTREFVEALNNFGVYDYFAGQNVEKWLGYLDMYDSDQSQLSFLQDPVADTNYPIHFDSSSSTYYPLADSNIIDDFLDDTGYSTIHNFTMSGGSENITYRLSGGYSDEDGIMVTNKDRFKKYNINAVMGADITKNLTSTTNFFYRNSDQTRPIASYSNAIQLRMYDPTGWFETEAGDVIPFESPGNVVRYRPANQTERNNLRLFQKLEYKPIENVSLVGEYTFEKRFSHGNNTNNGQIFASTFKFIPNLSADNSFLRSNIYRSSFNTTYNSVNFYGKYETSLDDHNFKTLVGLNREKSVSEGFWASRNGLISPTIPTFNLAIGENWDIADSYNDWSVMGYFARFNYDYKEKYFFEANGRYDGSSRFPEGSRFVFLPSFSAGWNLTKESFMESVDFITLLKLRGSWGEIGNQNTSDLYPSISGYEDYMASWVNIDTDLRYLTLAPGQLISNAFTWEKVRTRNIGLDAGLFKNKLQTSIDLYSRETLGMLSEGLDLPTILGTEAPDQNVADLETRGWEFEVKWNDRIGEVRYGINFNLSNNETKITRFENESGIITNNFVGKRLGDIWGYVTDGFYTVDDFVDGTLDAHLSGSDRQLKEGVVQIENANTPYPGDIKYKDLNGDGMINDGNGTLNTEFDENGNIISSTGPGDRKIIGNSNRKYQYGINGFVEYKGFDFSFVLSGVGKRDLWRNSDLVWPYPSVFDHIYKHQLNYWTPDNQNAYYPRVYGNPNGNTGSNYGNSRYVQTKYLSDESYIRIQNITFGYAFDKTVLDKIKLNNLRVFVAGNNLFTFDNLPEGLEPDQGSNGAYPIMKNVSLGLNLSF